MFNMFAGPDDTNQEQWPQHLLPSANPFLLTLSFLLSYFSTLTGKLLLAVTFSHYLRSTTHSGHPLLIQTQEVSVWSYTHQVIYLCLFMSPEGQGCFAFWGAAALRQYLIYWRPPARCRRGNAVPGEVGCVAVATRCSRLQPLPPIDTMEGEFGVAGSTQSYRG